jgi:hypothetical protein
LRGRPAHDHWMNSPSSGQHTAHYSPVIIAAFVDQFIALARWRPCAFFLDGSGPEETVSAGFALMAVTASAQSVAAKSRRDFHQSRARSESKGRGIYPYCDGGTYEGHPVREWMKPDRW